MTELVCESEVRREIACHRKAANWIARRISRLRDCLVARHFVKPDSPDSPYNQYECRSGNKGSESQFLHTFLVPHIIFLSPNRFMLACVQVTLSIFFTMFTSP